MPMGFDYENSPMVPNGYTANRQAYPQQQVAPQPQPAPQPQVQSQYQEPEISIEVGGFHFTSEDDSISDKKKMTINIDETKPVVKAERKKRTPRKKEESSNIIRAEGTVEETSTINTYSETANMLKGAMGQIDMVANEIKSELDNVRSSRTMKSKYNVMVGLTGNLSDLLQAKIGAIKELNNCITKSNDMDYKRAKDRKEAEGNSAHDEKIVMDLYRNIMQNPTAIGQTNPMQVTQPTSTPNIVRADDPNAPSMDQNYANYMANMPTNMMNMMYERNPDIQECVVFDASTGAKWFQIMNIKTMQPIPGAQAHDQMFMEDTTLDMKHGIAKNVNLNETYKLIVINDKTTKEY